jgi:myo-inositol 2-dehydrogenase/D-chiro-inositol 1-dehydrogenase
MTTYENSETLRVGVIGAGVMGAAHIDNLARMPGVTVSRVFDIDPARALAAAGRAGGAPSGSAEALIADDEVDGIVIAAPDPLHEPLTLACIAAGKPVLLEKPIASTLEGGRRVVDAEVVVGRRLVQVGFMRRYDPAYLALRDVVAGCSFGTVRAAHCIHRNTSSHPSHTDEGLLYNSMIHEFDGVPWLLDDPLVAVSVFSSGVVPGGELQDLQIAVLETESGSIVTVEVYLNAGYGYDIRTEVVATGGTASLTPPAGLAEDALQRYVDAYRIEVAGWVDGIRSGRLTGPTAWDGHRANVAAFSAVESLHGAGRVAIPAEMRPELYA